MIPTSVDLRSATMVHRASDHFNPPALTNFLGCVQAAVDPVAIWNLNFPPLACGDLITGHLFVDGRLFASSGEPVEFVWYPDRIERKATVNGLEVTSTTSLAWASTGAVVNFTIRNMSGGHRTSSCGLVLQGSVGRSVDGWRQPAAPVESDVVIDVDRERRAVVTTAPSGATSVQGVVGVEARPDDRALWFTVDLAPGETTQASFVHAVSDTLSGATQVFDELGADPSAVVESTREQWDAELAAVFTPGNDRYSGWLPTLETESDELRRLYLNGVLGVVYFKRISPHSVVGRTYDTLMPRYWQTLTYLWDYSLSSTVHALLDPAVMRGHLGRWMSRDVHDSYGTEWLTGDPVGIWYAVNDYAITQMIDEYVSWSGEKAWLGETVETQDGPRTVMSMFQEYAQYWRQFVSNGGLADYGGVGNLLECVSSYVHEVAAMNSANVWSMRTVAGYLEATDPGKARRLSEDADSLLSSLWALYEEGEGWFNARQPGGALLPVRHCYDLMTVLGTIPDDISEKRRTEMVGFFTSQLQTSNWMRALSPQDPDSVTSLRPDHQWNGAYTAWPAGIASGLFEIGQEELASNWMKGLARSANQGPFGQAHFTGDFVAAESGGAAKASAEIPFINDWACSSGGAWARLVIRSVFGVTPAADELRATPRLDHLDRNARLLNLRHGDDSYTIDHTGAHTG